ncbi:hypothetical protein ABQW55_011990 [Xanthomonas citri pv. malvacearum]|uniref:hypothetical protein n=1 Tax=Xanthomonas TaxID=338 RepID=UPI0012A79CDA|nr:MULTISPECIES: hypothetical protein [Xanthomonas]MCC4631634.1 hypothetical protein [Xanthomonas citri]QGL18052.1 hypothetical protein GH913_15545 [Xanthomonas citri pv. malvacearum]WAW85084.1 hypothetical protein LPY96_00650 [Xanthomonas citri pv. malvacearum]WAW85201.1 hypothetical protein LPY96_12600 [Xanthomonas citri pv. malvacearum]WAW89377.1 hypothetical protein LPY95_11455 [Xanthomonas citri pv. malvacearum]
MRDAAWSTTGVLGKASVLLIVAAMAGLPMESAQADEKIKPAGASGKIESLSDDEILERWWPAQDACRGRPDDVSACAKRDRLTAMLVARGYEQHNHDVWISPSEAGHFNGVVQSSDDWALNRSSVVILMAGPSALKTLRSHLSDDKIIALWNESNGSMRRDFPRAWSMLSPQMTQIVMDHKGENDVRYTLD